MRRVDQTTSQSQFKDTYFPRRGEEASEAFRDSEKPQP
jgi:hypothetical protein